jgi:cellulose biosynthesis protein BcsQ
LIPISSDVSVLMPPDKFAESMDLVCHADGLGIAQRIVEVARVLFDVVLVDTGGRMGPAVGGLIRSADVVLLVVDDTVLGLTAVDLYLSFIKSLVGSTEKLCFLVNPYSGAFTSIDQIAADLEPAHQLGEAPWRLPPIPNDAKAALWPGSGRTLYSMGQKSTRQALEQIAQGLGLIGGGAASRLPGDKVGAAVGDAQSGSSGWVKRIFGRK